MELSVREREVVADTEFLQIKAEILKKSWHLLERVRDQIRNSWDHENYLFPSDLILHSGKISRGENYQLMPYQILDFPALFQKEDIFAFRTMFWWGHHFSFTFHLQGEILEIYRDRIINALPRLVDQKLFLCTGDSPWQYHFEADNYSVLKDTHEDFIRECSFLKFSQRLKLSDWDHLPELAESFVRRIMGSVALK